jgi:hypothetical protein
VVSGDRHVFLDDRFSVWAIGSKKSKNVQHNSDVILRERSDTKDLRADPSANVIESAKILRLHSATLHYAQDDILLRCLSLS